MGSTFLLRFARPLAGAAILGSLAGCGLFTDPPPATQPSPRTEPAPPAATPAPMGMVVQRPRSRWVAVDWAELPGYGGDALRDWWPALLRGCDRPAPGWEGTCAAARALPANAAEETVRAFVQQRLRPWRIETAEGAADGLITGYFEPLVEAQRSARPPFRVPLYAPPDDLASRKPYWTRQQIDSNANAQASLRGRELAYVADPLDALLLQIQGSGRLAIAEANGTRRLVRVAYAAHNDHPYKSVGRWLIEQGELRADQASWPAIRAWAKANPKRVNELLWSNPRVVFFREEPLPDPGVGPRGAQAVPLTPGRSIAVDPGSVPYGTPVWLDTTEPLSTAPLRRLVMAQDTGSAIVGAVRADYFWGWGEEAEAQAGRMKQPLRMWALWPR